MNQYQRQFELHTCIIVSAPDWFEREDFQNWRNSEATVATWYKGETEGDFLDTFINFEELEDCWEDSFPADIKRELIDIISSIPQSLQYGVIWMKPF